MPCKMAKTFIKTLSQCIYEEFQSTLPEDELKASYIDAVKNLPSGKLKDDVNKNFNKHFNKLKKKLSQLCKSEIPELNASVNESLEEVTAELDTRNDAVSESTTSRLSNAHILLFNLMANPVVFPKKKVLSQFSDEQKKTAYCGFLSSAMERKDVSDAKIIRVIKQLQPLIKCEDGSSKSKFEWLPVVKLLQQLVVGGKPVGVIRLLQTLFQMCETDVENCLESQKSVRSCRLAEVLKTVLTSCHLKLAHQTLQKQDKQRYGQYVSTLCSYYIDLCCVQAASDAVDSKRLGHQICGFVSYLLQQGSELLIDVTLQTCQLSLTTFKHLSPLISKCLSTKPDVGQHNFYLKYVMLVRKVIDAIGTENQTVNEWLVLTRSVPASKTFIDWLKDMCPDSIDLIPIEDKKFRKTRVTRFLLEDATEELILMLLESLSGQEECVEDDDQDEAEPITDEVDAAEDVKAGETAEYAEELFYLDNAGSSSGTTKNVAPTASRSRVAGGGKVPILLKSIKDLEQIVDADENASGRDSPQSFIMDPSLISKHVKDAEARKFFQTAEIVSIQSIDDGKNRLQAVDDELSEMDGSDNDNEDGDAVEVYSVEDESETEATEGERKEVGSEKNTLNNISIHTEETLSAVHDSSFEEKDSEDEDVVQVGGSSENEEGNSSENEEGNSSENEEGNSSEDESIITASDHEKAEYVDKLDSSVRKSLRGSGWNISSPIKKVSPTSAKKVSPNSAKKVSPDSAKKVSPASAKKVSPDSAKKVSPASAKKVSPDSAKKVSPDSAKKVSPDSAKKVSPTSAKKVSPDSAKKVSPASAKKVSPNSAKKVSPDSAKKVSPNSAKKVSPDSAKRLPTSPTKKIAAISPTKKVSPVKKISSIPEKDIISINSVTSDSDVTSDSEHEANDETVLFAGTESQSEADEAITTAKGKSSAKKGTEKPSAKASKETNIDHEEEMSDSENEIGEAEVVSDSENEIPDSDNESVKKNTRKSIADKFIATALQRRSMTPKGEVFMKTYIKDSGRKVSSGSDKDGSKRTKSTEEIIGIVEEITKKIETPRRRVTKSKGETMFSDNSMESITSNQGNEETEEGVEGETSENGSPVRSPVKQTSRSPRKSVGKATKEVNHKEESDSASSSESETDGDAFEKQGNNATERLDKKTPKKSNSKTPKISDSKTPKTSDSKTPKLSDSKTPKKSDSKTPKRSDSKTPQKLDSKTPKTSDSKTPSRLSDNKSAKKADGKTPKKSEIKTPKRLLPEESDSESCADVIGRKVVSKSPKLSVVSSDELDSDTFVKLDEKLPKKSDCKTPNKSDSKTPNKSDSKTPNKLDSKTHNKSDSKTPKKSDSKTPNKSDSKTPKKSDSKTPLKSDSKTPKKSDSKTPLKSDSKTPKKSDSKTPKKSDSKTPLKSDSKTPKKPDSKNDEDVEIIEKEKSPKGSASKLKMKSKSANTTPAKTLDRKELDRSSESDVDEIVPSSQKKRKSDVISKSSSKSPRDETDSGKILIVTDSDTSSTTSIVVPSLHQHLKSPTLSKGRGLEEIENTPPKTKSPIVSSGKKTPGDSSKSKSSPNFTALKERKSKVDVSSPVIAKPAGKVAEIEDNDVTDEKDDEVPEISPPKKTRRSLRARKTNEVSESDTGMESDVSSVADPTQNKRARMATTEKAKQQKSEKPTVSTRRSIGRGGKDGGTKNVFEFPSDSESGVEPLLMDRKSSRRSVGGRMTTIKEKPSGSDTDSLVRTPDSKRPVRKMSASTSKVGVKEVEALRQTRKRRASGGNSDNSANSTDSEISFPQLKKVTAAASKKTAAKRLSIPSTVSEKQTAKVPTPSTNNTSKRYSLRKK